MCIDARVRSRGGGMRRGYGGACGLQVGQQDKLGGAGGVREGEISQKNTHERMRTCTQTHALSLGLVCARVVAAQRVKECNSPDKG
jgi:hypothetical protein